MANRRRLGNTVAFGLRLNGGKDFFCGVAHTAFAVTQVTCRWQSKRPHAAIRITRQPNTCVGTKHDTNSIIRTGETPVAPGAVRGTLCCDTRYPPIGVKTSSRGNANYSTARCMHWAAPLGLLRSRGIVYPGLRKRSQSSHLLHPGLIWGRPVGAGRIRKPKASAKHRRLRLADKRREKRPGRVRLSILPK